MVEACSVLDAPVVAQTIEGEPAVRKDFRVPLSACVETQHSNKYCVVGSMDCPDPSACAEQCTLLILPPPDSAR